MSRPELDLLLLLLIHRPHHARRRAEYETSRWNVGPGRYQRTRTHEAAAADARAVEDRRAHADQAEPLDGARVEDRAVADGAVIADRGSESVRGDVYDGAVLDARTRPDPD